MSQLADLEHVVAQYTHSDSEAGALFFDLIQTLGWDIEGVANESDATEYLNREEYAD